MFKKPYEICVEHRYTPYYMRVVFFLSNGKNGLITHYTETSKLGQMLPLSECLLRPILCICDMPEKRMRKEGLQYANGKLAICESQKKE